MNLTFTRETGSRNGKYWKGKGEGTGGGRGTRKRNGIETKKKIDCSTVSWRVGREKRRVTRRGMN